MIMAKETIIYGDLELPSGKKIKFREATGFDRLGVLSMQSSAKTQNLAVMQVLVDAYIAIKCIVEIDGEKVQKNYKDLYDELSESDLDFYSAVRSELFGVTKNKVAEQVDFLRANATSTAMSS